MPKCGTLGGDSISTLAPREGSDVGNFAVHTARNKFQPSLPARGATILAIFPRLQYSISTLAPREGSDALLSGVGRGKDTFQPSLPARGATSSLFVSVPYDDISTLAPREGSDRGS